MSAARVGVSGRACPAAAPPALQAGGGFRATPGLLPSNGWCAGGVCRWRPEDDEDDGKRARRRETTTTRAARYSSADDYNIWMPMAGTWPRCASATITRRASCHRHPRAPRQRPPRHRLGTRAPRRPSASSSSTSTSPARPTLITRKLLLVLLKRTLLIAPHHCTLPILFTREFTFVSPARASCSTGFVVHFGAAAAAASILSLRAAEDVCVERRACVSRYTSFEILNEVDYVPIAAADAAAPVRARALDFERSIHLPASARCKNLGKTVGRCFGFATLSACWVVVFEMVGK